MDRPLPWLRYVDSNDLDDIDLDDVPVRDEAGQALGNIDGFIVDVQSGRPYYLVVDSGGWFRSKHFLLPVGHAKITGADEIVAAVPKERIENFPGFDTDEFEQMSEGELRSMNNAICSASGVIPTSYSATEPLSAAWDRPDYRQPDWWTAASAASFAASGSDRRPETPDYGDVSPHQGGRAQPGDVLGVETGGEQTHIGDTSEDEDRRRQDADETVSKSRHH